MSTKKHRLTKEPIESLDGAKCSKTHHIHVKNCEGLAFLKDVQNNTIDLVLTDPPYITSRKSGMDTLHTDIQNASGKDIKTLEDWNTYRLKRSSEEWNSFMDKYDILETARDAKMKQFEHNYLQYGHILGKKYAVKTDYGDWDSSFTLEMLNDFVKEYHRVLKDGGVAIIWFDSWKIETLAEMMKKTGFKQLRHIVWEKTNPQPLNSSRNLLTNGLEFAVLGVKKSKPTYHSKYETGVYRFPIQGGKHRFHPTQKNVDLFAKLIETFSNEHDLVLDTFLGSGTTAVASKRLNRCFLGCELDKKFYEKTLERLSTNSKQFCGGRDI